MNKRNFIFLFITFLCINVYAQKDNPLNSNLYFSDSVQYEVYKTALKNPLNINILPNDINRAVLGYYYTKGKLINAQDATQINNIYFASDGKTSIRGIHLYGSFRYDKIFEDSTRFAHQTRNNTSTPYYYGSPAYNKYERTRYSFIINGAKDIIREKLTGGIGVDYKIADHFSNNDPRGRINEYQLNLNANLAYKINNNINIGLGYITGYGQETVDIGYKNKPYFESIVYPLYVNYLINGYGEPTPKTNKRKYKDLQSRTGGQFNLQVDNIYGSQLFLSAKVVNETQDYSYRSSDGIEKLADYKLVTNEINALWIKSLTENKLAVALSYKNLDGEDFNVLGGKNYVYTENLITSNIIFTQKKNNNLLNYTFNSTLHSINRIDGLTANDIYYQFFKLGLNFGYKNGLKEQKSIGINLGINYTHPLSSQLDLNPNNISYFTNEVISYDYVFYTIKKMGAAIGASYSFPFIKTFNAETKFQIAYLSTPDNIDQLYNNHQRVAIGSNRVFSNLSFNVYF